MFGSVAAVAALMAALVYPYVVPSDHGAARQVSRSPGTADLNPVTTASISPKVPAQVAPSTQPVSRSKIDAESISPPSGARAEPYRIAWPFDIADAITFGPEGATKTRLAGLEGPARDAVCNDREGRPWACGLQARAALNNITRQQKLVCDPSGPPTPAIVPARCRGDIDVAREMVLAGFARPVGPEPALDSALDEARRAERGLWNGGWTIRTALR